MHSGAEKMHVAWMATFTFTGSSLMYVCCIKQT